jgi:hypothetical protein
VISRPLLGAATAGFVVAAVLHLATFAPVPPPGDALSLLLLAGAFALLAAMVARLRRMGAPLRAWGRVRVYDWRALASLVPASLRWLVLATVLYALVNFLLSLALAGSLTATTAGGTFYLGEPGAAPREVSRAEWDAHRRVTARLLSGHLLLFYVVPLVFFRFVDPRLADLGRPLVAPQGGSP